MTYNFDAYLEAKTAAYYAELDARAEAAEQVVADTYMVFYTYSDGYVSDLLLSEKEIRKDYADLEELEEGLVKMEVYNVTEGFNGYEENELLYSEEF